MVPRITVAALCGLVLAFGTQGCGGDDPAEEAAAPVTTAVATPEATPEPTSEPTSESTPAAKSNCRAGGWDIYVSGGTGVSCKEAKKIQVLYLDGEKLPKGWECGVAACTKVAADGTVSDFYWKRR